MTDTLIAALKITGVGMTGIFFFMLIIGGLIMALHKNFPDKAEKAEKVTDNN